MIAESTVPPTGDRVLSVQEPWCSLLLSAHKPIENRTWATPYRGWVWLHTGTKPAYGPRSWPSLAAYLPGDVPLPSYESLRFRCVLGRAWLADCLPLQELPASLRRHWSAEGPVCWIFERPEVLPEPIPAKGMLNLWKWKG